MKQSPSSSVVAAVLLFAAGLSVAGGADPPRTLEIGQPAPDFALPGVDGRTYRLADFDSAQILAVVFTCNHCPTAQAYEQRVKKLVADYRDKGVAFVAISPNDPLALRLDELGYTDVSDGFEDMKLRAREQGFDFPYLYDGDRQEVSRRYGPVATPHLFIFDRARKLRYAGRIDDSEHQDRVTTHDARNALDALLAGTAVPVERTRTFGCSVKWSDKRDSVVEAERRWDAEPVALDKIGLDGVRDLVKNASDKYLLINVWATWCGPCVVEFPELVKMHRMYRGRPLELVTISADGPERSDQALAFLKKQRASMRNLLFDSTDVYALIEALDKEWSGALPHTLLIKPGGEIVYRATGQLEPLTVRRAIVGQLGRTY